MNERPWYGVGISFMGWCRSANTCNKRYGADKRYRSRSAMLIHFPLFYWHVPRDASRLDASLGILCISARGYYSLFSENDFVLGMKKICFVNLFSICD